MNMCLCCVILSQILLSILGFQHISNHNHMKSSFKIISLTNLYDTKLASNIDMPTILETSSIIAMETTKIVKKRKTSKVGNDDNNIVEKVVKVNKPRVKKEAPLSTRSLTGYNFYEGGKEFDVPFIDEYKWYYNKLYFVI